MLRKLQEHREDGQAIVFVAAAILGMLAFLGLAVDGGNVYLQRRNAQNAADAAAQAGTVALAQNYVKDVGEQTLTEAGLCAIMKDYGTVRNPSDPAQFIAMYAYRGTLVNCTSTAYVKPYEETLGTRAVAGINADSYISQIFGRSSFKVSANATVQYGPPSAISGGIGAAPITIYDKWLRGEVDDNGNPLSPARPKYDPDNPNDPNDPSTASPIITLWNSTKGTPGFPDSDGDRGWINPSCKDNRDLPDETCNNSHSATNTWMENGYMGEVAIGDELRTAGGTAASVIDSALARLRANPIIIVPLYDTVSTGSGSGRGTDYYHITGFAAFRITSTTKTGSYKEIKGYFINYVNPGQMGPAGTTPTGVVVVQPTG